MSKKTYLKTSLILLIGEFVTRFIGFVYFIPLKSLDETIGSINGYLMSPYSFFLLFAIIGLTNVMTTRLSPIVENKKKLKQEQVNLVTYLLIFSLGLMILLIIFSHLIISQQLATSDAAGVGDLQDYIRDLTISLQILAISIPFYAVSAFLRSNCFAHYKFTIVSVTYIIEQLLKVVILLPGAYILLRGIGADVSKVSYVLAWSVTASVIITFFILLFYSFKTKIISLGSFKLKRWQKQTFIGLFSIGIIYFLNSAYTSGFNFLDSLVFTKYYINTGDYSQAEANTLYGIYATWSWKLIMFAISLGAVFVTTMSRQISVLPTIKEKINEFDDIFELVIIYAFIAMIFFMTAGQYFYALIYGPSESGVAFLAAQSLLIPMFVLRALISVYALMRRRIALTVVSVILMFSGKLIFNPILFFFFQGQGLAYSSALATFVSIVFIFIFSDKLFLYTSKSFKRKGVIALKLISILVILIATQYLLEMTTLAVIYKFILESLVLLGAVFIMFKEYLTELLNLQRQNKV